MTWAFRAVEIRGGPLRVNGQPLLLIPVAPIAMNTIRHGVTW